MQWLLPLLFLAASHKQPGWKEPFDKAQKLFADAYYAEAIGQLDNLLARTDLSQPVRREGLFMLGSCHLGLDHESAARARYIELLSEEIDYVLPDYTPRKVRAAFEALRTQRKNMPTLEARSPTTDVTAQNGEVVVLEFNAAKLTPGRVLEVHYRRGSQSAFTKVDGGSGKVSIPLGILAEKSSVKVEYFARITEAGETLVSVGSESAPLVFVADKQTKTVTSAEKPVYQKAWFWVVISAAVAGAAGAGVAIYAVSQNNIPPTGTLSIHYGVGP